MLSQIMCENEQWIVINSVDTCNNRVDRHTDQIHRLNKLLSLTHYPLTWISRTLFMLFLWTYLVVYTSRESKQREALGPLFNWLWINR